MPRIDEYQRRAVTTTARYVRVLAGAGSGKTRTLTSRIARLVVKGGVPPSRIRAVTFSKKAAVEMADRLFQLHIAGVAVSTLHSLGYEIVRRHFTGWGVADTSKKRMLMRRALKKAGYPCSFPEAMQGIGPAKTRYCELEFAAVLKAYEAERREARLLDFDDMLIEALELLRGGAAREHWDHVLVDEAQDTDPLQWMLLYELLGEASLFVVGDASQSIYKFRGAVPMEMLEGLDLMLGDVEQIELPRNYRSVRPIVDLANETVRGRQGALELESNRADEGHVNVLMVDGMRDAARRVVERLEADALNRPVNYGDHAVLYRTNACAEAFENAFIKAKIPYVIVGDFSFYGRREIMDVLAYLRLSQGWDEEAAERVYNRPARYLGAAFRRELERQGGWPAVFERHESLRFSKGFMADKLDLFVFVVAELQSMAQAGKKPAALIEYVLYDAGYRNWLVGEEPDQQDEVRDENLTMLLEAAADADSVQTLLDIAAQCRRQGTRRDLPKDAVQLLTVHRAKGLEWPVVYLAGCDVGLMPHKNGDPEEERRIAYVAFTRARDELVVFTARGSEYIEHLLPRESDDDDGAAGTSAAEGDTHCVGEPDAADGPAGDDTLAGVHAEVFACPRAGVSTGGQR